MANYLRSGAFTPMGDPDKAAKAMIDLVDSSEPPLHLVLGSEAYGMLKMADEARNAELEKWKAVSLSTDHDQAVNFLETEVGKSLMKQ